MFLLSKTLFTTKNKKSYMGSCSVLTHDINTENQSIFNNIDYLVSQNLYRDVFPMWQLAPVHLLSSVFSFSPTNRERTILTLYYWLLLVYRCGEWVCSEWIYRSDLRNVNLQAHLTQTGLSASQGRVHIPSPGVFTRSNGFALLKHESDEHWNMMNVEKVEFSRWALQKMLILLLLFVLFPV